MTGGLLLFSLLLLLGQGGFASCDAPDCCKEPGEYGPENTLPINELSPDTMRLVRSVENGKLYEVKVPHNAIVSENDAEDVPDDSRSSPPANVFHLLHLWGTPFEMGFAAGSVRPKSVSQKFVADVWEYLVEKVEKSLPGYLPKWLDELIATVGLDVAMDLTYDVTKEYTNPAIYEELRGFAKASGVDYATLVRIHMLPGLTQGKCSMFGAWGDALPHGEGLTKMLQMRALDWEMNGPIIAWPQVTVYHPDDGNGHPFVNVGIMTFIGGLTGMSKVGLGISEIGASCPDSTFGSESRVGLPFVFLLRDILQYDTNLQNATDRMINSRRTCDLILGVGDGNEEEFNAFEYSYEHLYAFSWANQRPLEPWHPRIKDVVYYGMDWQCSSFNGVLANLTRRHYGEFTAPLAIRKISAVLKSGDTHIAFYELDRQEIWLSFGAKEGTPGQRGAYARQFTHMKGTDLWNEPRP